MCVVCVCMFFFFFFFFFFGLVFNFKIKKIKNKKILNEKKKTPPLATFVPNVVVLLPYTNFFDPKIKSKTHYMER